MNFLEICMDKSAQVIKEGHIFFVNEIFVDEVISLKKYIPRISLP